MGTGELVVVIYRKHATSRTCYCRFILNRFRFLAHMLFYSSFSSSRLVFGESNSCNRNKPCGKKRTQTLAWTMHLQGYNLILEGRDRDACSSKEIPLQKRMLIFLKDYYIRAQGHFVLYYDQNKDMSWTLEFWDAFKKYKSI